MATFKPEEASGILRKFADELAPSAEYQKSGNTAADDIFDALRKATGYVARVSIAGSIGKHTSLGDSTKPDYDLVAFCNGKLPPFAPVVKEFKTILLAPKEKSGLKGPVKVEDEDDMKLTLAYNGYKFDLCPASNFAAKESGDAVTKSDRVTWIVQKQQTYKIIEAAAGGQQQHIAQVLNTGLVEASVRFMKNQPAFVHALVRLAKFWARTMDGVIGKLRGESLMIETIAVDAALRALTTKEADSGLMHMALKEFLNNMANINKIKCIFLVNYNLENIPAGIKAQIPLVLDPSSPYDNLASNMTPKQIQIFQAAAKEILGKIDGIRTGGPDPASVLKPVGTISAFKG